MSPVKVFGHPMLTNVARVLLFLEEVGAEYELVPMDFVAGEHKRPQHVQLNPFAKMPGFQDGDLVLFESRAIAKYILRKYGGTAGLDLLGENSGIEELAMVDVWTEISFADLNHIPFTFYFMTTPYAKVFDDYPKVKAWWEMLMARPAVQRVCKHMPTEFKLGAQY
ncbi:unnamed protein product [Triticum turgidum subsp. durum]|uniref:glutathione transferase n=1 Tax=Triticum turgidum subsp. durum TaxID=4567 RepID=A0A9R1RZ30_TRITD|nr:unnamed protein product [Triticum turgidum subsp. durum]